MNICVFCSSNDLEEKYAKHTKEVAELLAQGGHTVFYGGSDSGQMKLLADVVQENNGKIVAVTIDRWKPFVRKSADEIIFAKTLGDRKALFVERADTVIMMAGGLGTLDEATEIMELRKQDKHEIVVIVLNTDGFYDGLKTQLQRMADEGFLQIGEQKDAQAKSLDELVQFADTPQEVMQKIGQIKLPKEKLTLLDTVQEAAS